MMTSLTRAVVNQRTHHRPFAMPMRGPKVGPSPAKLVDATPPEAAAEIPSTWRAAIRSADAETSTDLVSRRNVRCDTRI